MARVYSDAEVFGSAPAAKKPLTDDEVFGPSSVNVPAGVAAVRPAKRTLGDRFSDNFEEGRRGSLFGAGADAMAANIGGSRGAFERARNVDEAASYALRSDADPWYDAPGGLFGKAAAGAATLGGIVAGSLTSPESLIGPGKTALGRIAGNAAVSAGVDVPVQGLQNLAGTHEGYDPLRTAGAAATGAVIQGGFEAAGASVRAAGRGLAKPKGASLSDAEVFGDAPGRLSDSPGRPEGVSATDLAPSSPAPATDSPGVTAGYPIAALVRRAAERHGVDPNTLETIARLESGLNPQAKNPNSSAGGLFQFVDGTWKAYGGGDKFDAQRSAEAGAALARDNAATLRQALGREPDGWEVYLAHQQGAGGARALLTGGDKPAVDVLRQIGVKDPEAAIRLNGGNLDMSAGAFADLWRQRYAKAAGEFSGQYARPPAQAVLAPRLPDDGFQIAEFREQYAHAREAGAVGDDLRAKFTPNPEAFRSGPIGPTAPGLEGPAAPSFKSGIAPEMLPRLGRAEAPVIGRPYDPSEGFAYNTRSSTRPPARVDSRAAIGAGLPRLPKLAMPDVPKGSVASLDEVLMAASRPTGHAPERVQLAPVSEWLKGEARTAGLDLDGYRHVVDASAVRHIRTQHGDPQAEAGRGQLAVTDDHLRAIPDIIAEPDHVVFGSKGRRGGDQVAYLKQMPDGSILHLEEVRTGRRELAAVSMRRYPGAIDAESFARLVNPNGRTDAGDGLKIVSRPGSGKLAALSLASSARGLRASPIPGAVPRQPAPSGRFESETVSQLAARLRSRLRSDLGVPARQGRVMRGALGEYDPANGVLRTKAVQELDVLSHEATHALEFHGGPALKAVLQAHDAELRPLAYPGANPAHIREEGFAEFGRWYVTNPTHARQIAPKFYDAFEAALAQDHPNVLADLKAIQEGYQRFLSAPSLDTAAASIAYAGKPGPLSRMRSAVAEKGWKGVFGDLADNAYTAFVDDLHPLAKAVQGLQAIYAANKGARLDLQAAKNPYALARLARDAYAAGHVDLMDGVVPYGGIDPKGPSLSQALETALGAKALGKWSQQSLRELDAYLVARRMVHEFDRWERGALKNPPDRNSKAYHQAVIQTAEGANPTWADAAKLIYGWQDALWRKERDAGLITPEAYEAGLKDHPDYVPLMRDMSDKAPTGSGKPRGSLQHAGGVKQFRGSTRDVISPLSSMMRRAYELNALIKRNDVIRALDDLAQQAGHGAGLWVERLPAKQAEAIHVDALEALTRAAEEAGLSERDISTLVASADAALSSETQATLFRMKDINPAKGEAVVYAWRKGKKTPLLLADGQMGQDLFTALTGLNNDLRSAVVDGMAAATQTLRYGVTLSPEFMSRNFVRDQVATWINTDVGFKPVISSLRGAASELSQDQWAKRYAVAGGLRGGANVAATSKPFPKSDREAMAQLQHLRAKGYKVRRFASWRGLAEMTDLSETSTRLGVFKAAFDKAKRQGLSDVEAVTEAAFTSRDYLDFGRRGSKMLSAVRLVTFLNASLQSLDKSVRVLSASGNLHNALRPLFGGEAHTPAEKRALAHATKAWAKVSMLGVMGLGLRMMYADDPEYEEIGDQLRATHWVAKVGGEWLFVPKPFELATLSNIFERAYEAGALNDPTAPERLLSDFGHTIAPPHEIPAVSVPFAIAKNRDYQGRPVVPDHLRGTVDPALQFNSYTSQLGRKIGEALKVSPAVVDYVITGVGGSLGRYALQGANYAYETATGAPRSASGPEDTFLVRGFVKNPARGSTSQAAFWDRVSRDGGEYTRAEGTFRAYMKAGDDAKATDYLNGLEPAARAYVQAKVFSFAGTSRFHPMVRAQEVVSTIGDVRQEARDNALKRANGQPIDLSPQQMRQVDDALTDLAMAEMRDALVLVGEKGWAHKAPIPRDKAIEQLMRASPEVASALAERYGLANIPTPQVAGRFWSLQRGGLEAEQDPVPLGRKMLLKRATSGTLDERLRSLRREPALR